MSRIISGLAGFPGGNLFTHRAVESSKELVLRSEATSQSSKTRARHDTNGLTSIKRHTGSLLPSTFYSLLSKGRQLIIPATQLNEGEKTSHTEKNSSAIESKHQLQLSHICPYFVF